ncbi:DUF559 domain-containing protein, partial [uncultured Mycobacterium sp.]|uniref:DUF559 domain-containing protein n=1 Tax=uncultured Mycobacterium sp. TaxID=171292 RepID=UPI0035CC0EFF
ATSWSAATSHHARAIPREEDAKVAVEYDGDQHRSDRSQYSWDIRRLEMLERRGWIVIRVMATDRPADIVRRVRAALARRT